MRPKYLLLSEDWQQKINSFLPKEFFVEMEQKLLDQKNQGHIIYPSLEDVLKAYKETPFSSVKVVWLGQDPYHNPSEATGLCFAVKQGTKMPPSLRNLFQELKQDLKVEPPHSDLLSWANQGILLLNATLSVKENEPQSHKLLGWHYLLNATIKALLNENRPLVFVLLGKASENLIKPFQQDLKPFHKLVVAPHPSPLSAHRGFFGSKIYSQINQALKELNLSSIDFSK
jgi:uracil-DNA glycosylase